MYQCANLDTCELGRFRPDAIVSLETAEHLREPELFLSACRDALTPRAGVLVFSAPTCLTMDYDPYHRRDWSAERWRDALRRAGFRVECETPMPFTATFGEFLRLTPTTLLQKARVASYALRHPRYLADRLLNWGLRNRFSWESTLFACHT